ncbi:MAG: heavy-metal-associated domain-containing protein [Caldilineales bacterium]|nr:heavy-metal-associated domain-containing protein [Caldilineales bacterium]
MIEQKQDKEHDGDCHVEPLQKVIAPADLERAQAAFLAVWGMGCPNCALRVRNSLLALDGVLTADIMVEHGVARVLYDPTRVVPEIFSAAVAGAGNDGRHHYTAQLLS